MLTTKPENVTKKILIDARLYGLENAGLGRYTMNLLSQLSKLDKKNEYIILLRKKYFHSLNFSKNFKKILADFRHYSLTEQIAIPRIISKQKPDLVHFLHMNVPLFYNNKFVVTVHDLLMQKHRGANATTLPFYSYFSKLMAAKYIFKNAVIKSSRIIVPSEAVKNEIIEYYKIKPTKIEKTYEGVSDFPKADNSKKILNKYKIKKPFLIYSGNAYPHKNLEKAIQSIKSANESGVEINFYITCSRSIFTKKLEETILKKKVGDYVKYLGFVEDNELSTLFKESLGFLYPSLSEGFGLQGLEAMKSETLVLCSNIPVFKEIYKDVPFYFDPFEPSSIEQTIRKVISIQGKERINKINKGRELVNNYSWEKMTLKTLSIYEKLLHEDE